MVEIDYKTANDIDLQTLITEHPKMFKISDKIINLITEAVKNSHLKLTEGRQTQEEVKIQRIFRNFYVATLLCT